MNRTTVTHKLQVIASALSLLFYSCAQAASGTWNGTESAYWTNSPNWSAAFPTGGDTATFNNAGNGRVNLDLAGLSGILNVTFDTASAGAYILGAGAANSQTLVMGDGGTFRLNSSVTADQTFNAAVQLGPNTATASYSLRNDAPGQTLTLNNVWGTTGGTKTLNLDGSGPFAVAGTLDRKGSTLYVNHNSTGALNLSGNSYLNQLQINGAGSVINLAAGTTMTFNNGGGANLMSAQNCTINGPGAIVLSTSGGEAYADNGAATGTTLTINARLTGNNGFEYWHGTYRGTIALRGNNDFSQNVIMNVPGTISCTNIGPKSVASNLGAGTTIIHNGGNARLLYLGAGESTDRTVNMRQDGIIEQGGSGNLNFTAPITVSAGTKTLTLQGSTAGTGEFSGAIRNDAGVINLKKEGSGSWSLSAANPYTGTTVMNGGKLLVTGASGAISGSSSLALSAGAELVLHNTDSANNADRLRDAMPVTLSGATLSFSNTVGAAATSESAGMLHVAAGANTINVSQAAVEQTATVTFAGLGIVAGTLDFVGTGIGANNRIFITGLAEGPLGAWATVNGTAFAAYSNADGIYALAAATTNIAARGPDSVIPDDASVEAHITTAGTSGAITLAGATENSIFLVQQDTATDAVVATAGKTLKTLQLGISAGQADLTVGEAAGDGSVTPLAAGGVLMLANDDASSVLTVNAGIANNTSASSLIKSGAGAVVLAGANSYSGLTGILEGSLTVAGSATQTLAGVISGPGALAKEGSGLLTLPVANTYAGLTTVSNGTLRVLNSSSLGASTAGTLIGGGGTLDAGTTAALNLNAEQITVSGAGVNGRGAIVNSTATAQYNFLRLVTLAGDTTFGGEHKDGRWDIRNASGTSTFLMNNYSVTKVGSNYVGLTNVGVTPGATAGIDIQEGWFTAEGTTTLGGGPANTMTVRSGAVFDIYDLVTPVAWSLVMEDNSRFYARAGNVTNRNIWAGPVTLNGRAVFDASGTFSDTISGPISGPGSVVKIRNELTTYFRNPANTYAGTTTISNGTLYAQTPGSLPGYNDGRVTVLGGAYLATHAWNGGDIGWTPEEIRDLNYAANFTANNAYLTLDTSTGSMVMPYDLTNRMGLIKQGSGSLTLAGTNARGSSETRAYGGELVINGDGAHQYGAFLTTTANLTLTNATGMSLDVTNTSSYFADNAGNSSVIRIGGKTAWNAYMQPYNQGQGIFVVGQRGNAVVHLTDDASVRQRLYLGNYGGSAGAIYQSGNTKMHNWGGASSDGRIGMTGYGYYELNSGTFTNNGYFHLGRDYTGVGILNQSGGQFEMGSVYGGSLGLSRGGTGVVYTAGGTFRTSSQLNVGESSDNGAMRGYASFTADALADVFINGIIWMADRTNMFAAVNFNGGTVVANQIRRAIRPGSLAHVNFDGGTFRPRQAGNIFDVGAYAVDAINLYAGGATLDTTNLSCTVALPLLAPAGNGVTGISVDATPGYIGPPMVTIAGDGTGATAIATFDSASGTLTGVRVTSPGFGYSGSPAVTLSGGGKTNHPAATAFVASNVSGGLTKQGAGDLFLTATNTYAGATTVSNGMLKIVVRDALPTGTDIAVAGGILDLGGFALTNGDVTVSSGALVNGSLAINGFSKVGSGPFSLATPLSASEPLVINSGVVKFQGPLPGLYEAPVAGSFNVTDPMTTSIVTRLTTRMANLVYTEPYNTTWIYKGYIWNRASTNVTWTFAENFDDNVKLTIDSTVMMTNGASWNVPTLSTITLTPGAHTFEARFGQGGGGGGPVNGNSTTPTSWWTSTAIGFGIDFLGRNETNIANYAALADSGDGSLLTLTAVGVSTTNLISATSEVELGAGAVLDLAEFTQTFASLSGSGIVSNGTLSVGELRPGGDGTLGTLTVANSAGLSGTLKVDVGPAGTSDTLAIAGDVDLSALTLEIANPGALDANQTYTIASISGTRTGTFGSVVVPDSRWHVVYLSDGTVQLLFARGTLFKIR